MSHYSEQVRKSVIVHMTQCTQKTKVSNASKMDALLGKCAPVKMIANKRMKKRSWRICFSFNLRPVAFGPPEPAAHLQGLFHLVNIRTRLLLGCAVKHEQCRCTVWKKWANASCHVWFKPAQCLLCFAVDLNCMTSPIMWDYSRQSYMPASADKGCKL